MNSRHENPLDAGGWNLLCGDPLEGLLDPTVIVCDGLPYEKALLLFRTALAAINLVLVNT